MKFSLDFYCDTHGGVRVLIIEHLICFIINCHDKCDAGILM